MIIPVLTGYEKLQEMFDTIDYPIKHAIIIDNGGNLKKLNCNFIEEISIINMPYNTGISIPYNIGIKLTPMSKYWLLTQNDVTWIPGGLEKIHQRATSNNTCIGLSTCRPFACRTLGENVIRTVGLLDESYFPAPGDDFNYHKRCHYRNIEEVDIGDTYVPEKSWTIYNMVNNGEISYRVWNENFYRSALGAPIDHGWNLSRRRQQESDNSIYQPFIDNMDKVLNNEYVIHTEWENHAFKQGIIRQ